jgi:NADH-quinone oxidoreductase subunit E
MLQFPQGKHKSALLRILHIAQHEFGGWLSADTMDYVAEVLKIKPIEVYEVAHCAGHHGGRTNTADQGV